MDYRKFGQEILAAFKHYVEESTDKYFDELQKKGMHYVRME